MRRKLIAIATCFMMVICTFGSLPAGVFAASATNGQGEDNLPVLEMDGTDTESKGLKAGPSSMAEEGSQNSAGKDNLARESQGKDIMAKEPDSKNSGDQLEVVECSTKGEYYKELTALVDQEDDYIVEADKSGDYQAARILMHADSGMDLSKYEGAVKVIESYDGTYVVQFETSDQAKAAVAKLNKKKKVDYAEPDAPVSIQESQVDVGNNQAKAKEEAAGASQQAEGENAASYNQSAAAYNYYTWGGSGSTNMGFDAYANYARSRSNSGLVVAVLDTGVSTYNSVFNGRMVAGRNFAYGNYNTADDHGHGTHVAGTIADCTRGYTGIKIMPVKVLNYSGMGYASTLTAAIKWSADNGAQVINLSLLGGHSSAKDSAINYAIKKGATCVIASGNSSRKISKTKDCPAHLSNVIVVGAVDSSLKRASFSNYGSSVDVVAPGVSVASAHHLYSGSAWMSGTSMATPHIAACAALIKVANRNLSPSQIETTIKHCAVDLGSKGKDNYYGYGYPDLRTLLSENYVPAQKVTSYKDLKSSHNYGNSYDELKYYTAKSGTKYLKVKFSENTKVENNYDFITILDGNNRVVGKYTGTQLAGRTIEVPTRTVKIRLVSDSVNTDWGYAVDSISRVTSISKPTLSSVKLNSEKPGYIYMAWNKKSYTGYEVARATSSKFKASDTVTGSLESPDITACLIRGIVGKKNYVKVRAYKNIKVANYTYVYYSSWSKTKNVKVK